MIVALQVRRDPMILVENIEYWLEQLKPTFPVFCHGWNPEWPTRTLPWTVLFDHTGREVYAGKPERIELAIEQALAAAPDPMIGGPYERRRELAAKIAADRAHLGAHLARLRAEDDPDAEQRAVIDAAERWFERQTKRIDEDLPGVVEQAEAWNELAGTYAGDELGERATRERDALRAAPGYADEEAAETALRRARANFRGCPPRGSYIPYNFTRVNYTVIEDPVWVATRVRMIAEFRIALKRIARAWPATHAAEEASDLLFLNDVPRLSPAAAGERVERAESLLLAGSRPAELHEAWLLLVEVREGAPGADEASARAAEILAALEGERAEELAAAGTEARALREEAERLDSEVRSAGSLLSRAKADEVMARLNDVAARSGNGTVLARRIAAYVAELAGSFDGRPHVGVRLDQRFPGPGARIAQVDPGTGAAKAGLVPGDVILELGGTALAGIDDLAKALADRKPGESVKIAVRRATGKTEPLELLLGRRLR